jgi:hypothetical protein
MLPPDPTFDHSTLSVIKADKCEEYSGFKPEIDIKFRSFKELESMGEGHDFEKDGVKYLSCKNREFT